MKHYQYVILGGGLAAGYAAQTFAEEGVPAGDLCILSAEERLPYERPPLSKGFLAGEEDADDIWINEPGFYEEHGIDIYLNSPVTAVDLDQKQLHTEEDTITYDSLLIATGARVRHFSDLLGGELELPGMALEGIYYLRRVSDARQIRQQIEEGKKAVVIGGSFIGMETASVLQRKGVQTTLVFPEERVWEAFFTPEMSAFFRDYYEERGVEVLPGQNIKRFEGNGRVTEVVLENGRSLPADFVVAGIGVQPNSELFRDSELQIEEGGIVVNRFLETNLPDVFAAGDVARYRDVLFDKSQRIEHWDNAVAQGQHAARAMLGKREKFVHVPYFFSDVFDLSYEFWGDTSLAVQTVHRGDVENGRFSAWWLNEAQQLVAAFAMNRPDEERELAPQWIRSGKKLDPAHLADAGQSLETEKEPAVT